MFAPVQAVAAALIRRDVFARTAEWVEDNKLECATYHILTPYPKTPLFRQLEAEGRVLRFRRVLAARPVEPPASGQPVRLPTVVYASV